LVKLRRDGVADPVEDDDVHRYPPMIIGRSIIHDMLDEGVALKSLLNEVTPAGVLGGGVEDDVHQLADIEDRSRLKVKAGDDCVCVERRDGGDDLRGRGRGRRKRQQALLGGSGRLL
jgi:hypothetical protein